MSRDCESLRLVLVLFILRLLFGHLLFGQTAAAYDFGVAHNEHEKVCLSQSGSGQSAVADDFGVAHNEQVYVGRVCLSQSGFGQSALADDFGVAHNEQVYVGRVN